MVYVSTKRVRYHFPPSGKVYKARKATPISYGPFETVADADAWANLKGVTHYKISDHAENDHITVRKVYP